MIDRRLLLPYAALVLVHLAFGAGAEQPVILADEVGYLGNARYLSGTAPLPNMRGSQFYHFGYSLFLLPAFWLFSDPVAAYRAAIAINALMVSALLFPLHAFLKTLAVPPDRGRWIAFTCCLYPSLLLYSRFAWSENAFIVVYAAAAALLGRLLVSPSVRRAIAFGLAAGFLYTIHPRALPVVGAALVFLLALFVVRAVPRRLALTSFAAVGAVFAVTRLVNGHLNELGWSGGGEFSPTTLAGRLVPGTDFGLLIARGAGQLLYLVQASHGLFLVGLAGAALLVVARWRERPSFAGLLSSPSASLPLFVALTAGGIFIASCTAKLYSPHGPDGLRGADLIHGRYNEAFAVLFIALGLAELGRRRSRRELLLGLGGLAAASLLVTAVAAREVDDAYRRHDPSVPEAILAAGVPAANVDGVNVPGVFPLVHLLDELDLYAMSVASMAVLFVVGLVTRVTRRGGMGLVGGLFSLFAVLNHHYYVVPASATLPLRARFVEQMKRVGPIASMSYDVAHLEPEIFFGAQFLMPETRFHRFDSRKRERPTSEAVISGNKWRQARRLGAVFVVSSGWDNALWALPGEIQARLPELGYEGRTLGVAPLLGLQEAGFHLPERFFGTPGRWTKGAAALKVPVSPGDPPARLAIETLVPGPGRDAARLRLLANRVVLWDGPVPTDLWSRSFELDEVPIDDELLIELESDATDAPPDERRGVVLRGIRLMGADGADDLELEGLLLGVAPVLGLEESGFYLPETIAGAPGRWTDGAARLRVPLGGTSERPRLLAIETSAPGREEVRLSLTVNGVVLWDGTVPGEAWTMTFRLDGVPMDEALLIELESDTFTPPESADVRRLGVVVRGIRLTARERF